MKFLIFSYFSQFSKLPIIFSNVTGNELFVQNTIDIWWNLDYLGSFFN